MQTLIDNILNGVYADLNIQNQSYEQKYNNINNIVDTLKQIHAVNTIN